MKILRLGLKNLASLSGEQEICFETTPLAHAGLIAITGKTGAGKSTLLDAMCLALFNQVPRLTGAVGKIKDSSGEDVSIKDAKQILRRGCVQGYAELEFIALDQKRYLARWDVRRTRNKPDGNLKLERFVKCLDDGKTLTQKLNDCNPCIQDLIGLTFEQFTRAVLLAQSEVGAFLKAKDEDRASLLEYLTNSNIFSVVGQASFEKTKSYKLELEKIESVLGHIELLSDDEYYELQQQKVQTQTKLTTLQTQQKQLEQAQQWYVDDQKQQINIQQQQDRLQALEQLDLTEKKQQLQQLEQFQEIRETYSNIAHATTEKNNYQQQLKQIQSQDITAQYHHALQHMQTCEQKYNTALEDFKTLQPSIQQAQQLDFKHTQLLEDHKHQKQKLEQYKTDDLKQQLEQTVLRLQQLETTHQHTQTNLNNLQVGHLLDEPKSNIQKLEQYDELCQIIGNTQIQFIENLDKKIEQTQQEIEQQQTQLHYAYALQRSIENYQNLVSQHQQQQTQLIQLNEQQTQLTAQEQQAQQCYQTATTDLEHLQRILEQQRLLHTQNVTQLREQLKPQQPCMVCGSLEHPFVTQGIQQLQDQQLELAIHQQKQSLNEWQQLQKQLSICTTQIEQLQPIDLEKIKQQIDQDLQQTGLKTIEECNTTEFEKQLQETKQTLIQLQKQHKIQHAFEQKQNLEASLGHITNSKQLIQNIKQAIQLQTAHQQQKEQIQQLRTDVEKQQLHYDALHTQQQQLQQQLENIEKLGKENKQTLKDLLAPHTQMQSGEAWLNELEHHNHCLNQTFKEAQQQLQTREQLYKQQQQDMVRTQDQIDMWQQQINHNQKKQTLWLNQHSLFTPNLIEFCLKTLNYQDLRDEIKQIEQQQQQARTHLDVLKKQYQQHLALQPTVTHQQINQHQTELHHTLNEAQQQLEQIMAQLIAHQQAQKQHAQYQQQISHLQAQLNRWGKISQIIGSSDGAKFKRVAQEHHLDILVEYANQQLQPLAPRYQLKRISDSLGLSIIDHDMNGEIRPVLSLSGGETFLVSLALALAIANMASGSMKLESLFIDEGFGTLDPTSLHIVMDALDRLQSQGRKVVLISHVQEMHERIPVQIQVKPTGAGTSQISVVG
ncbi:AAA family ATPase [Acinetobacter sp. HY1485]|uniref:AAA family ATPase n=1 Tax=Acinetobacter sp. HY1485 TaxID=2970918 RepID=UPI0022B96E8B|nr:SbcC/MukB-like Walker B domain-containing protein [Acinetobacter sp. HY1485]